MSESLDKMLKTYDKSMYVIQIRSTDDGYALDGYYVGEAEVSEEVYSMFGLLLDRIGELELRAELSAQAHAGREQVPQPDNMRKLLINDLEDFRLEDGFNQKLMRWTHFFWCHGGISMQSAKSAKRGGFIHLCETTRTSLEEMNDEALLETYHLVIRQKSKMM